MKVYEIARREQHLFLVSLCLFCGLVFLLPFITWVLGLQPLNGKEQPTSDDYVLVGFGFLVGCFLCYIGWNKLNNHPYEICIYDNGIVEFRRIRGSVTMNATEIRGMKKYMVDDDGEKVRGLSVQPPDSEMTIENFSGLEELMAHLLSLNPAIVVQGSWTT